MASAAAPSSRIRSIAFRRPCSLTGAHVRRIGATTPGYRVLVLEVRSISKRFGALQALDDVSFRVDRGQVVGFLGPNGAGKTTAMRAILGLLALDAGSVTWAGDAVDARVRTRIGYMPAER